MWIQLTSVQKIEMRGVAKTYYPGDCVEVGKQFATLLISQNAAREMGKDNAIARDLSGAGVVASDMSTAQAIFSGFDGLTFEEYDPSGPPPLIFDRQICLDVQSGAQPRMLPVGLSLLSKWELIAPMADYRVLACDVGTADEKARTQAITRDLRIPLYNPGFMFVRKTPATERIFEFWSADGGDTQHALLRAINRVPHLFLPVPITWVGKNAD